MSPWLLLSPLLALQIFLMVTPILYLIRGVAQGVMSE